MKKPIPVINMSKLTYQLLAKKDVIGLRTRIFNEYGDISCYRIKGIRNVYIRNPEHVGQILTYNQENYLKRHPIVMESFCPFTGRGINFNNDPIEWRRDRASALMPLEPSIYFNDYSIQVVEKCKKMLQSWEDKQNELINVEVEIGELILDITAATLFIHLDVRPQRF